MNLKKIDNTVKTIRPAIRHLSVVALSGCLITGFTTGAMADVNVTGFIFETAVDRDSEEDVVFQNLGNMGNFIIFDGTQDIGHGLTAGFNARFGSFGGDDPSTDQHSIRLSGSFGTLDLGQNVAASNFMDSYDGTPSYEVDPMGWWNVFSATATNSAVRASGSTSSGAISTGATGRNERLRYTSPTFSGVTFSAQSGEGGQSEMSIGYSDKGIIANALIIDDGNSATDEIISFLLAYNSPLGLFASAVQSTQDVAGGVEHQVTGYKLGYGNGKHSVSYSMHTFDSGDSTEYERSNLTYVFDITSSVQLFAQYGQEEEGTTIDDEAFAIGAGIYF